MPRVSIRKLFVYLLAVASCILLALNIQQRATGLFTSSLTPSDPGPAGPSVPPSGPQHQPVPIAERKTPEVEIKPVKPKKKLDGKTISIIHYFTEGPV